jgi:hypothetical protein
MPVYPSGNTRTYHPMQSFKELTQERSAKRNEGTVGGWMPAVRKVLPGGYASYYEIVVFGDVRATDRFMVQTWHRACSGWKDRQGRVRPQLSGLHESP